jgi:hypothetical protein
VLDVDVGDSQTAADAAVLGHAELAEVLRQRGVRVLSVPLPSLRRVLTRRISLKPSGSRRLSTQTAAAYEPYAAGRTKKAMAAYCAAAARIVSTWKSSW